MQILNLCSSVYQEALQTADGHVVVWRRLSLHTLGPLVIAEDQHSIAAPACANNCHDVCGVSSQNAD